MGYYSMHTYNTYFQSQKENKLEYACNIFIVEREFVAIYCIMKCPHSPTAAIEASGGALSRIVTTSSELVSKQEDLETALEDVADLADSLLEECKRTSGANCEGLPHRSIFVSNANYSQVSSLHTYVRILSISYTLNIFSGIFWSSFLILIDTHVQATIFSIALLSSIICCHTIYRALYFHFFV